MNPAYDCMNQLGSVAWEVNKDVFNVADKMFIMGSLNPDDRRVRSRLDKVNVIMVTFYVLIKKE